MQVAPDFLRDHRIFLEVPDCINMEYTRYIYGVMHIVTNASFFKDWKFWHGQIHWVAMKDIGVFRWAKKKIFLILML